VKVRHTGLRPNESESDSKAGSESENDRKALIGVSVDRAAKISGLGRTVLYEDIMSGVLPSGKRGRRRIIRVKDLVDYVDRIVEGQLEDIRSKK